MNKRQVILANKHYLKGLAHTIKMLKIDFKESQRNGKWDERYTLLNELRKSKHEYRHKHITYCLCRKLDDILDEHGCITDETWKIYYTIERTTREDNEPDWEYIAELSKEYTSVSEMEDETVICSNS